MTTPAEKEVMVEQPDSAELYRFAVGGSETGEIEPTYYYFTSYFNRVTVDGQPYEAIPIQRGSINISADLSDITMDVSINAASDFANLFHGDYQPSDVGVIVKKYFIGDDTADLVVFSGYITGAALDEGVLRLSCNSLLYPVSKEVPRVRAQSKCNNVLFDSSCGLDPDDWVIDAVVTSVSNTRISVSYTLPGGYGTTPSGGFFTFGRIRNVETDEESVAIVEDFSDNDSATLIIQYPMNDMAIGYAVKLYPGCNKTFAWGIEVSRCKNSCTSFSNTVKFLGMEEIPYKNPTITPVVA